jgi:site-specific DNA-methyltransferase (adenine-specific)
MTNNEIQLFHGDCLDVLPTLADNSVDAVVTDPSYGLGLGQERNRGWDESTIANRVEVWSHVLRVLKPGGHALVFSSARTYHRMACAVEDAGFEVRDQLMWITASGFPKSYSLHGEWEGWGTRLKPSHDPICMARKPLVGTLEENVRLYGTGALNIKDNYSESGRWPTNVVHDGSDEVVQAFPDAPGQLARASARGGGSRPQQNVYGSMGRGSNGRAPRVEDSRSAARFFYCAKVSKSDRGPGNDHPTVKPTSLMQYLVRLVTPPGGVVLDLFMGSGSTGKACMLEGFGFIGIDLSERWVQVARERLGLATEEVS